MTITQQDVIDILETGTYPSTQKPLAYYQQKQKFPIYPFVEVRKVQSDSNTTDVTKTTIEQTFEVRYYSKWTRPEDVEEADRLATENEILNVLETANIEPPDVIYFESKQWLTSIIDDQIYGSKSVLRFTVRDIASTTGVGLIGSGDKIELNSEGTPLTIQILAITTVQGFSVDKHYIDERKAVYDPNQLIEFGEFTITYESDPTTTAIIKAISDSGNSNNGKLIRTGDEVQYTFYVGQTSSTGRYGEIETASTTFYADSIWV
jgi:hypothetical protein